jgi:hypothetical protein
MMRGTRIGAEADEGRLTSTGRGASDRARRCRMKAGGDDKLGIVE